MESLSPSPQLLQPPRVTVLMAVYNGAAYLRQAVDSILAQTFRDFEFLIVDDGSTDDSRAILQSYTDPRIRIVDNDENIGLTRSLNRGLAESRGALIARQDADDMSHPDRLEIQVAFMDAHPRMAMVGSQARYMKERGAPRVSRLLWKAATPPGIRFQMLIDNPFFHTSVVFRRQIVWEMLGGYNENFRTNQDFELWSRVLTEYHAVNVRERLVDYRWNPRSISTKGSANLHLVERVFERNAKSVWGGSLQSAYSPAIWTSVTNPALLSAFSPSEVFDALRTIYRFFIQQELEEDARAEIRMLYASKILWVAQMCAAKDKWASIKAALRAIAICPKLIIPELAITVLRVLLFHPRMTDRTTGSPRAAAGLYDDKVQS